MAANQKNRAANFGAALFTLGVDDLEAAVDFGMLRTDITINQVDARGDSFGDAYDQKRNIAQALYGSQKVIQTRCKEFAKKCGFQLYVKFNSTKPDSTGNAKYACNYLK